MSVDKGDIFNPNAPINYKSSLSIKNVRIRS